MATSPSEVVSGLPAAESWSVASAEAACQVTVVGGATPVELAALVAALGVLAARRRRRVAAQPAAVPAPPSSPATPPLFAARPRTDGWSAPRLGWSDPRRILAGGVGRAAGGARS